MVKANFFSFRIEGVDCDGAECMEASWIDWSCLKGVKESRNGVMRRKIDLETMNK